MISDRLAQNPTQVYLINNKNAELNMELELLPSLLITLHKKDLISNIFICNHICICDIMCGFSVF